MNLTTHTAAIRETLAELARVAATAGDTANANALNQADYQIGRGALANVVESYGDLLIPSKGDAGTIYRVGLHPCTCTAGRKGQPCWHAALFEGWQTAMERATAYDDDAIEAAPARAIIDANVLLHGISDAEHLAAVAEQGPICPARPGHPWAPDYITEIWP